MPSFYSDSHCIQGRRQSMEDEHVHFDNFNTEVGIEDQVQRAFYAIYDGHGGDNVAKLCKERYHKCLGEIIKNKKEDESIDDAVIRSYKECDESILVDCNKSGDKSGATAVTVYIEDDQLTVANLGDAEAVLVRMKDGVPTPICISKKHKPLDPSEQERIKSAGGRIFMGRVMGSLAVSRAFGDREFKAISGSITDLLVSNSPFIQTFTLTPDDVALVLACDGLWDKMTYERCAEMCSDFRKSGVDPHACAYKLIEESYNRSSMDNISCIVVYLSW